MQQANLEAEVMSNSLALLIRHQLLGLLHMMIRVLLQMSSESGMAD